MKFGLGEASPRVEDERLLRGAGRYTDDISVPGQAFAYVVRSPHAHARIKSISTTQAQQAPGVLGVLTADDVDGYGSLPCLVPKLVPAAGRPDGSPMVVPHRPLLIRDTVRFVGDYVALVVAESFDQAKDAAELVDVDYEELPANAALLDAVGEQAIPVWPECADNVCFGMTIGDSGKVSDALARAHHVTTLDVPISRLSVAQMEPRAALGVFDVHDGRYTLYSGNQFPNDTRTWIAQDILGIAETDLRVVSPDMGGSFGLRATIFPELVLVLLAAKRFGVPVKWRGERSESFLSDDHARDVRMRVELGLAADGEMLAMRVESIASLGAYLSLFGPFPAFGNLGGLAGVYKTPAICVNVRGIFTHSTPIGPYRGAGRPDATLAIEQAIDVAARELGMDKVALRRRNLIAPSEMPFQTGLTFLYDCGEFEHNMDAALARADYAGFEARREEAHARGRLRGMAVVNTIEQAAGLFDEGAEIRFDAGGTATVYMGVHSHGQGHETVFRQVLADKLGLEFESVRYVQGDTDLVAYGHGTGGSRSAALGGSALVGAAARIVEKGTKLAALAFEASPEDVSFADGAFHIAGTDRRITLQDVAKMAYAPTVPKPGLDSGLTAFASFRPPGPTFPNGCHVCEVEIDPETGVLEIVAYWVVKDVGTVMNPMLLEGQLQGGIVQGLSQILFENIVWDETSQLVSGSFMDYTMPRADNVPFCDIQTHSVPTEKNPLGIKGAGEAGTVGGLACMSNAVLDALAPLGVRTVAMPATPERIWRAIRAAS